MFILYSPFAWVCSLHYCFRPVLFEELYFLRCMSVFLVFYLFWYWRLTNKPIY
ncbi:hypothetical protein SynRS9915_01111 [Synechococcus sp. RS9915]|nr:hypothetical protein SynRS9915_01111 [Synechococcus sp. RS9915]